MTIRDRLTEFLQNPEVAAWYKAVDLKPRTKDGYLLRLMQFFDRLRISPTQYLKECNGSRKQLLGRIKAALGEVKDHSASLAHQQRAALVSFTEYYQDQFDEPCVIAYKVKVRRVRMKKGLTFEDAERIIAECSHRIVRSSDSSCGRAWIKALSPTSTETRSLWLRLAGNSRIRPETTYALIFRLASRTRTSTLCAFQREPWKT